MNEITKNKNGLGAPSGLSRGWALRVLARWAKSALSLDHPAWATKLATNVTKNCSKTVLEKNIKNYWKTQLWTNNIFGKN